MLEVQANVAIEPQGSWPNDYNVNGAPTGHLCVSWKVSSALHALQEVD